MSAMNHGGTENTEIKNRRLSAGRLVRRGPRTANLPQKSQSDDTEGTEQDREGVGNSLMQALTMLSLRLRDFA